MNIRLGTTFINNCVEQLPKGALSTLLQADAAANLLEALECLRIRQGKVEAGETHLARLPSRMLNDVQRLPLIVEDTFGKAAVLRLAELWHRRPEAA